MPIGSETINCQCMPGTYSSVSILGGINAGCIMAVQDTKDSKTTAILITHVIILEISQEVGVRTHTYLCKLHI